VILRRIPSPGGAPGVILRRIPSPGGAVRTCRAPPRRGRGAVGVRRVSRRQAGGLRPVPDPPPSSNGENGGSTCGCARASLRDHAAETNALEVGQWGSEARAACAPCVTRGQIIELSASYASCPATRIGSRNAVAPLPHFNRVSFAAEVGVGVEVITGWEGRVGSGRHSRAFVNLSTSRSCEASPNA
jgi:hypothetical protein